VALLALGHIKTPLPATSLYLKGLSRAQSIARIPNLTYLSGADLLQT